MSSDEPVRRDGATNIAFIAALELECSSLRRHMPRAAPWLVVQSGPGLARAGQAAARAIESGAVLLVSWGLAGGLAASLSPGTVVVPRRVIGQDGEAFAVDAGWHSRCATLADELALDYGDLLTAPRALESPADKRAAAAASGAVAVDMESAAIAAVAERARVPFVVLRVIVDGVDDALPQGAEHWIDEHGRQRKSAALRAAVNVRQWRPLLTLAKRYRVASGALDRLAHVLAARQLLAADGAAPRARS